MSEPMQPFQHVPGTPREFTAASPSQIKTYLLCPRKWFYESILGFRSPPNEKAQRGTDAHKELEDWYEHGIEPPTPQVKLSLEDPRMPVRENLPLIEQWLPIILPSGIQMRQKADLIDLSNRVCPIVVDHKTSGTTEHFLNEYQLRDDPQMLAYARAVLEIYAPEAPSITLMQNQISWGALDTPRVVEATLSRDTVMAKWSKIEDEAIARMRQDAVKSVTEVHANLNACSAYGGCPHIERCQSAMFATIEKEPEMRSKSPFLSTLSEDLPLEVATTKPKTRGEVMTAPSIAIQIETLYVDCLPSEVEVTYLSDLLYEPMQELARKTGVPDWRLHEYGKGKGHIATALKSLAAQGRLPANVFINQNEDWSSVALEVLAPLAAAHVYGTR